MDIVDHLLRGAIARVAVPSLEGWLARLATCPFERPIDRALWAGFEADRLGYAFVGGYQAALAQLMVTARTRLGAEAAYTWPSPSTRLCLAATEKGGGHPRAIETRVARIDGVIRLRGEKTFATLAAAADEILVVASCGENEDRRNRLSLVRVRRDLPGVTMTERAPTPFAPEIPHARVTLDVEVSNDAILPGDGYDVYLKPFRTIEDTHVLGAAMGNVLATARACAFDRSVMATAFAIVIALREVAAMPASDPATHVALQGLFDLTRALLARSEPEWDKAAAATRERWQRDLPLLGIAEMAREQRSEAAWRALAAL